MQVQLADIEIEGFPGITPKDTFDEMFALNCV